MPGITWIQFRCVRYYLWSPVCLLQNRILRNLMFHPFLCDSSQKFSNLQLPPKLISGRRFVGKNSIRTREKCWNCKKTAEVSRFTCVNCGALQYPDPQMNYFKLLDLPINFDLQVEDISTKYKSLQMIFHPDRFTQSSQEEIDISDHYSKLVNKAYSTLKNPLSRGLYILELNGLSIEDSDVKMNQTFLLEVLEKNEELEKISDVKSLKAMSDMNNKALTEQISIVSKAFKDNNLHAARDVLLKMKYLVNFDNEIKKKKSDLGVVD